MHEKIIWNKNHDIVISNFSLVRSLIPEYDENNKLIEKNHFLLQQLINQNNLSNINTYMTNDNYNKYLFNPADLIKLINILQKLRKNPTLK